MRSVGRLAAVILALTLSGSSAPMFVCAQATRLPCAPPMAHPGCHEAPTPILSCCCTRSNSPAQMPASESGQATLLLPAQAPSIVILVQPAIVAVPSGHSTHEYRTRDLPTLFSTFLL